MLSPWLTFRQAREALRAGRPDEAQRLIDPFVAEGYRKAVRLTREVARAYLARGEKHLRADNAEAAWADLLAAEALNTGESAAIQLRQTLTRLGLAVCRAALEAGNPLHVIETAARLTDRSVRNPELDNLAETAREWVQAAEQADRGDFPLAKETLARCKARVPPILTAGMDRFLADLDARHERFRVAVGHLNDAAEARRWRDALRWADEAIAAAPDHREARDLRARAWAALQPEHHTAPYRPEVESEVQLAFAPASASAAVAAATRTGGPLPVARRSSAARSSRPEPCTGGPGAPLPKRFLLWVDGVGGYLVCLSPRVTFGQAVGDGPVDVPLFAELSRLHAELFRDGEGYVLESAREVLVNGTPVPRTVLRPGDRLTLGTTCQLLFHLPVPISPSARLELVSGHRLPLAVDGIVLMAETLVLGPGEQAHVPLLPDAPGSVVLYRGKEGLGVRAPGQFRVDNRPCQDRSDLPLPSVVTADGFTFAVEPVGPRL
jgi:tetratricopeptide (TPR) repeat protein